MAIADDMVTAIETALQDSPGVVEIQTPDGTRVKYDRGQALSELQYWKRQQQIAANTRQKVKQIDLGGAW